MNKFQKLAYQIAKDDSKKGVYNFPIKLHKNVIYSNWKKHRDEYPFIKCLSFKNFNKTLKF